MSLHIKLKYKIIAILLVIVPAFFVGSFAFGANVYYDVDTNSIMTSHQSEFTSNSTDELNKALSVYQTGVTTDLTGTDYGLYVTNIGASTTNVGGYFSASGGVTNNYGLIVENGNVGIGTTSPTANFQVAQSTIGPGTVQILGTTAVIGTGTQFTNTFKVGDTITVDTETVRTIDTITDNTHLTVTDVFLTSASGLTYTLNGGTRFSVLGNGRIGIGDSSGGFMTYFQGGDQTVQNSDIIYTLPSALPSENKFLQSTSAGVLTWESASSGIVVNVGSMSDSLVFGDASASGQWLGLGDGTKVGEEDYTGRIAFQGNVGAMDYVNILGANMGIGTSTPSSTLTLSSSGDFAIGDYNANLIDAMEYADTAAIQAVWVLTEDSGTPGESTITLESANVRKGSGAMKITTTTGELSVNDVVKKTFGANQNYSGFERIGFWIKATESGQIISFRINDSAGGISTHMVMISEANQWQYEEYNIASITPKNAISWVDFLIDNDTDSPIFYIDQLRLYKYNERTSEMFVDNDGNLVVWGRGGVEFGRGVPGASLAGVKIGSANIEVNQPLNVNVPGDTGMAYDLQFLNTGGSNITSLGALIISAGDPNKTQNLTLTTQSNQMSGDSGVVTSTTASSLDDSSKSWIAGEWIGGIVYIVSGTGVGQERIVTGNDTDTINVANWTINPDLTSSYRLAYKQGGDVIVDISNSSNNYGGFKVAGIDNGSYVFRIGSDGNVEIGGNGTSGSSLTIKQNLTLTGGNITVNRLDISQAGTPIGTVSTSGGSIAADDYYYVVTALNNNGETSQSSESVVITTSGSTSSILLSWSSVSGAIGYKVYRTTISGDYTSPSFISYVSAPINYYTDIAANAFSGAPPAVNSTGGRIAINTSDPSKNLEVLENTSGEAQMRLISDLDNYSDFYTDAVGDLTISSAGGDVKILNENLSVCAGGACPAISSSGLGNIQAEGDVYAAGGYKNTFSFAQSDIAASQTSVAIDVLGQAGNTEYVLPYDGSIVGISVASNAARTAGTLTVDATINDAPTGFQAVLNTNTKYASNVQDVNTDVFFAGGRLGVKITTDGSWAPTTADIIVTVIIEY